MEPELLDCSWCGSAKSVENGLCQVCLMDYSKHAEVIPLPTGTRPKLTSPVEHEIGVAE